MACKRLWAIPRNCACGAECNFAAWCGAAHKKRDIPPTVHPCPKPRAWRAVCFPSSALSASGHGSERATLPLSLLDGKLPVCSFSIAPRGGFVNRRCIKTVLAESRRKMSAVPIDRCAARCYTEEKSISQTVEAEITAIMPIQRARVAESRARNRSSNGPLRVQSNARFSRKVFCNVWAYVSCRGYVGILLSARRVAVNSRWHRG